MKKATLFLGLIIGLSFNIYAQTQISYIDNPVPALELERNGLVNIDGADYLLESDKNHFRVSSISDSIRLIYEVSDYPSGQNVHHAGGSLNTRSGFIVDGEYLYELFYSLLRKRNILTGEIEAEYPCPFLDLNYKSKVEVVEGIIHIEFDDPSELAIFNTETEEFTVLPLDPNVTFRSGNKYYTKHENNGILELNVKTNESDVLFEGDQFIQYGTNSNLNGQKGIIFSTASITRFLNADTTFLLSCSFENIDAPDLNIHEADNHYITFASNQDVSTIQIMSKDDCSQQTVETIELNAENQKIKIHEPKALDGEYLIIEAYDAYDFKDIPISLYLVDKGDLSITLIDNEQIGFIGDSKFFRSGNEIYFGGHGMYDIYIQWNLYSINLETKEFKLNLDEFSYELPILFGSSERDSTIFIPRLKSEITNIYKFYDGDNSALIPRVNQSRNIGILPIEYLTIKDEVLVFKNNRDIYYADNNEVGDDKIRLITTADEASKFIIQDDIAYGLINNNGSTYRIRSNMITNQLNAANMPDFVPLDKETIAFSNYIFAQSLLAEKKYFDIQTGDFKEIPIPESIVSMHISNNHMIFLTNCAFGYCLTSFKDGVFTDVDKAFEFDPKVFSKGNGEFMITENYFDEENRLVVIKNDGSVGEEIIVKGKLRFNDYEQIEKGPLSALMFYDSGTGNLEIVLHRYEKFHRHIVPFIHGGVAPILWYKAGNSIILESEDDEEPGIYVLTLGKETKKLELFNPGQFGYELQFTSHENGILSFYVFSFQNGLDIIQYDPESENIVYNPIDVSQLVYDRYFKNTIIRISPTEHYVTFSIDFGTGQKENSELHNFDASEPSLTALPDLNERNQLSNPHQFIASSTHIFFVARSPSDNSYQLFTKQKDAITDTKNTIQSQTIINVHPNPSSDDISIDLDADNINIINTKGQLVRNIKGYLKNQKIDVSDMQSGFYFIEIRSRNEISNSSFIKQ